MVDYLAKIIVDIETHDVQGIIECLEHSVSPNDNFNGRPLFEELTSGYMRGSRFKDCVKAFVDHGLIFEDPVLIAVLLNNADALAQHLQNDRHLINRRYSMRCAFTPLRDVSLLHICAEFNHLSCAEVLLTNGMQIDIAAGMDEHGFGGQSPIFHTVNQILHRSVDMFNFLIDHDANLQLNVRGLIWGEGYDWETFIPAVNPISYAMMGLLPQMHRATSDVSIVVSTLMNKAYNIDYIIPNMPNKYLAK